MGRTIVTERDLRQQWRIRQQPEFQDYPKFDQIGQAADQVKDTVGGTTKQAPDMTIPMDESLPEGYEALEQPFSDDQGNTFLQAQDDEGNTVIVRRSTDDDGNTIDSLFDPVGNLMDENIVKEAAEDEAEEEEPQDLAGQMDESLPEGYEVVGEPTTDEEGNTVNIMPESATPSPDNYMDRLLKYIPAESITLYLTLQGIILSGAADSPATNTWLWFILGIGLIGTALYQWRVLKVGKVLQLAISTVAFGVWVFALGGAFASLSWYEPFIGSLALVIFTFFVPLISPDVLISEEAA